MTINKQTLRIKQLAGLILMSGLGCASLPGATSMPVRVNVEAPVMLFEVEDSGWGMGTHPILRPLANNRVMLSYFIGGDGNLVGNARVSWPMYTDDGGETWVFGDPMQWCSEPPPDYTTYVEKGAYFRSHRKGLIWGPTRLPDGQRIMFDVVAGKRRGANRVIERVFRNLRSPDGVCWELAPDVQFQFPDTIEHHAAKIAVDSPSVVLPDGTILVTVWARHHRQHHTWSYLFESKDEGRSFQFKSVIASPNDAGWGREGPNEAAMMYLAETDTILCILRTGTSGGLSGKSRSDPMLMARSADQGVTWTHTQLPMHGVMPKLIRMSNGILVCAYGRPGNHLAFSADAGLTWGGFTAITRPEVGTSGYFDVVEVSPGRLLVVYDLIRVAGTADPKDRTSKDVNRMMRVFVNVSPRM